MKYGVGLSNTKETMDDTVDESMKISAILCIVVFSLVCIGFIVFCFVVQRKCKICRSHRTVNEHNLVSNETRSSSIFTIEASSTEDSPPSYEIGIRSETPPPLFETLFSNIQDNCSDIESVDIKNKDDF